MMLNGKCALVTGSTSGIGWGIAQALASAGAVIMLHGLEKESDVKRLKDIIESIPLSRRPPYSNENISTENGCKCLIKSANEKLGKIDILVNNAGIQYTSSTQNFPTEQWENIMKINLFAPFYLSRAVLPYMCSNKWGRIINIGSAHSLVGSINKSAYVASKHGLLGLSKVIALEVAAFGVTSNTICPGYVMTQIVQKQIDALSKLKNTSNALSTNQFLKEKQPTEEFITPENIGGIATFLCSSYADQVTGAAWSVDGGWTTR